ncbi:MAG: metallophosphoesterase family protein [Verrucomicrobiota bacterium]
MPVFAVGDIHGCYRALSTLIEQIAPQPGKDSIIFLGDYVDRGPDTKSCLELLISLEAKGIATCLRGNHEEMMTKARSSMSDAHLWLSVGGDTVLDSYNASNTDQIPDLHWDFIERLLPYYETEDAIYVHAGLDPNVPMPDQCKWDLFWEFFDSPDPHYSGKTMICGHTSQKSGLPVSVEHAICIDTYVYGENGWLTGLNVETLEYFQANENGKNRSGTLSVSDH